MITHSSVVTKYRQDSNINTVCVCVCVCVYGNTCCLHNQVNDLSLEYPSIQISERERAGETERQGERERKTVRGGDGERQ